MGTRYLIDTNVAIYYLGEILMPVKGLDFLDNIFPDGKNISIVTKLELLGYNFPSFREEKKTIDFIDTSNIYRLTVEIEEATIQLRKKTKLKLPDAIVGATALVNHFILITRNVADFKNIDELQLLNPFDF